MLILFQFILFGALALIIHESGHLAAAKCCNVPASELGLGLGPRLCIVRLGAVRFSLRLLPLGSFVRLDGTALLERSVPQQLLVHLAGILFNLIAALITPGTIFSRVNLLIAVGNLLPFYKHDGWKCSVVLMRALLRKKSQPVEWAFTFSGGFISLVVLCSVLRVIIP